MLFPTFISMTIDPWGSEATYLLRVVIIIVIIITIIVI